MDLMTNATIHRAKAALETASAPAATARDLAQIARCLMLAKSTGDNPADVARSLYSGTDSFVGRMMQKTSVGGMTSGSEGAGAEFISPSLVAPEFSQAVRPRTILGRMETIGVPLNRDLGVISARS